MTTLNWEVKKKKKSVSLEMGPKKKFQNYAFPCILFPPSRYQLFAHQHFPQPSSGLIIFHQVYLNNFLIWFLSPSESVGKVTECGGRQPHVIV